MMCFPCPYLHGEVELSSEREQHIAETLPDLLPTHRDRIANTLANPDEVRKSPHFGNARLFSRWFDAVRGGKHVVVVVVLDDRPHGRNWIVTAYISRRLAEGEVEWKRN